MRGSLARVGTEETRQESYLGMLGTDPVLRLDEGVDPNIWSDKVFFLTFMSLFQYSSTNSLFIKKQNIFVAKEKENFISDINVII